MIIPDHHVYDFCSIMLVTKLLRICHLWTYMYQSVLLDLPVWMSFEIKGFNDIEVKVILHMDEFYKKQELLWYLLLGYYYSIKHDDLHSSFYCFFLFFEFRNRNFLKKTPKNIFFIVFLKVLSNTYIFFKYFYCKNMYFVP